MYVYVFVTLQVCMVYGVVLMVVLRTVGMYWHVSYVWYWYVWSVLWVLYVGCVWCVCVLRMCMYVSWCMYSTYGMCGTSAMVCLALYHWIVLNPKVLDSSCLEMSWTYLILLRLVAYCLASCWKVFDGFVLVFVTIRHSVCIVNCLVIEIWLCSWLQFHLYCIAFFFFALFCIFDCTCMNCVDL